ncbi:MAG: hypothetical protein A2X94_14280 [Bdellovibrionales bacterium GWB1_55_8]|nr:MAG: hypothetical protein A2X94_14280 [Bdellovibrionales bacterium GWB1_55_8]
MNRGLAPILALLVCSGFLSSAVHAAVGPSCQSDDPNWICLGLKYVVYRENGADPIVSELETLKNLEVINNLWSQCNIGFQVDQYVAAGPGEYKLKFRTANISELDEIREAFNDDTALLVVTTGAWDRTGSLGNSGANAWTAMPGGPPYGAILERPVASFSNIIAHEIGHYLNLLHADDSTFLMNPIIYKRSTRISSADCRRARSAARDFWSKMLR